MPEQVTEANPKQGATGNLSFRERMRERLAAERESGEPAGPPEGYEDAPAPEANPSEQSDVPVGDGYEEALDPARHAEAEPTEELREQPTEDPAQPEEAVAESSDDAEADDAVPAEIRELTERAERAEERAQNMERDYRIKTHKIAAATRDLEDSQSIVQKQAAFIMNIADQGVAQFDNVNWADLRTKPEQYRQVKQAYDAAMLQQDTLRRNFQGLAQNHQQQMEVAKSREAEVSKDILRTTIDGWSNDLYGELRTFAVNELSYTEAEFDNMTDWRRIRDIHAQYQLSKTTEEVVSLRRKKAKQPAQRQVERPVAQPRNAQGQFADARQAFFDNPGDPKARRGFFEEKLRAERGRR
ncbi:MAG: hypothetical protein QNI96_05280 [Woeseiaceae bacterium]|nr:hypothetical protein [Woeseiaceae bacterium]